MFQFPRLCESDLPNVLKWRTSEDVTRYMFTDISDPSINSQIAWFKSMQLDHSQKYWLIKYANKPIGVLSQNDINLTCQRSSWGFYIGEPEMRNLGGLIPPYFYNFLFTQTSMNKLIAEVMGHNTQVIKLHKLHGYKEVGVFSNHVRKLNDWYDIHIFELLREDWLAQRRFRRYQAEFE